MLRLMKLPRMDYLPSNSACRLIGFSLNALVISGEVVDGGM